MASIATATMATMATMATTATGYYGHFCYYWLLATAATIATTATIGCWLLIGYYCYTLVPNGHHLDPYHMVTGTRGMAVVPPGMVAGETFVVECELSPEAL